MAFSLNGFLSQVHWHLREKENNIQKTSNKASIVKKHKGTGTAQPLITNHFSMAVQIIRLSLYRTKLNKYSSGSISDSCVFQIHSTSIPAYAQDLFIAIL